MWIETSASDGIAFSELSPALHTACCSKIRSRASNEACLASNEACLASDEACPAIRAARWTKNHQYRVSTSVTCKARD